MDLPLRICKDRFSHGPLAVQYSPFKLSVNLRMMSNLRSKYKITDHKGSPWLCLVLGAEEGLYPLRRKKASFPFSFPGNSVHNEANVWKMS